MDNKANAKEKIILPKATQREMMKFFLRTSIPKIISNKKHQQNSPNPDMEASKRD